jgi:ArsR family transcriptional regulator
MADCACGTTPESTLSDGDIDRHTTRLKALSSPVRLRMVDLIYNGGGEICVCEFMDHFDLSQPTISHHLKVLREAGLIKSRQEGTYVYHRVDRQAFTGLAALMDRLRTVRESVASPTPDTVA